LRPGNTPPSADGNKHLSAPSISPGGSRDSPADGGGLLSPMLGGVGTTTAGGTMVSMPPPPRRSSPDLLGNLDHPAPYTPDLHLDLDLDLDLDLVSPLS